MTEMKNWFDIEYLQHGSDRQKDAYRILKETDILSLLKDYDPVLAGTIPIDIDIEGSDLDIICCASDFNIFQKIVWEHFSYYRGFSDKMTKDVYVVNFKYDDLEIEIYTTNRSSYLQNGYRHMIVEDRILGLAGNEFKEEIIRLKKEGLKTEPAFGKLLNMKEPYSELLELEDLDEDELKSFIRKHCVLFHG